MRISFDSAADFYDRTRGPPKPVMKQLIRRLRNELSGCKMILDAGVGTGRFAKPLQHSGFEVVGVDIAKKMLEKAAEKGAGNLLQSDVCFLPLKDNSFDATVCVHLLHLISRWKAALQEICRVTQKAMVSTIYTQKNPIRETYNRLLKGYGYDSRRPGKGEWELKELVKPSKSVFTASFDNSADERLTYLSQRAYSSQWEVPEDVNKKVVDELKRQFGGRVFPQELRVLVWNIDDLEAYCSNFTLTASKARNQ